ncbi:MAG: hypothetical protein IPK88_04260 [Saprospiraceae bacterium]|nr:hypothetical protein [Candidatus Defluviibacterium haderslevense]
MEIDKESVKKEIPKQDKSPFKWDTLIQGGILLITFFAFDNSRLMNQATLKTIAESEVRDSLNSIRDSIRNARFLELSGQQIVALNQQAHALERSVRNTEMSEAPILDILNLGFHIDKLQDPGYDHFLNEEDSLVLKYKVINRGIRPAVLRQVLSYSFDKNFKLVSKDTFNTTIRLVKDNVLNRTHLTPRGTIHIGLNEVMNTDDAYLCFIFKFTDQSLGVNIDTKHDPVIFKWVKKPSQNLFYQQEGLEKFFAFNVCTDEEKLKILSILGKLKK